MPPPSTLAPDARGPLVGERVAIPVGDVAAQETDQAGPAQPATPEVREVAPVIRSKIEPPQLRSSTLSRGRLLESLASAIRRRVTLVIAEAGYGKTTLLTDFSSRPLARCLWYKLDSTDQDWITLVNYVVAAARELEPAFGQRTIALLVNDPTGMPPREAVVGSLIAELQSLADSEVVLILDDFHAIDESIEACDLVMRLLRDAPASFRFVLASRRRPPLLLGRLATMGEVSEIGTDELRFSLEETERLFAEAYGRPLARDVVQEIDSRTRGWAATLQLVNSSIRGRSESAVRSLARAISGGEGRLYDFLAQEVLARLPAVLHDFVVRAALLHEIRPEYVVPLFAEKPAIDSAEAWIEEADRIGILNRSSESSSVRQFHPLFREFLERQLNRIFSRDDVQAMHSRVARAASARDPLVAAHHFIEGDQPQAAMHCLSASAMLTMGSGRWGTASELIGRLQDVKPDPVIAAIQARRLLEDGDVSAASAMLAGVDVSGEPPAVRAVFRHTQLSLGWRSRDSEAVFATLREIEADGETPELLREIAQVFVDASPLSPTPVSFPALSQRLQRMAHNQAQAGHSYYAAISLHNAAIAELNAGRFQDAMRIASLALDAFDGLATASADRYSTHPILAECALELGQPDDAEEEIRISLASGAEKGDVHASCAHSLAVVGETERSTALLLSADALESRGHSDLQAAALVLLTRSLLQLRVDPRTTLATLGTMDLNSPLDLGFNLEHHTLVALAHLMLGDRAAAISAAQIGVDAARRRAGLRSQVRLELVLALAHQDSTRVRSSIAQASRVGELALLTVADAIGMNLDLVADIPPELSASVGRWKTRWLPILRHELGRGDVPSARVAARLLDDHGALEDVPRLRAYEKTYLRRRATGLGRALAHRVSPRLEIRDLGRVILRIGDGLIPISRVRRKPASLLMYLVTKPSFTAAREQVLDELWPDADPVSAMNSLNQSLYYLRRELDQWYEDDVSVNYVGYEGEVLWLDQSLAIVESSEFLKDAKSLMRTSFTAEQALALAGRYPAPFSPEFEYEEWAIAWRSRVHASFLEFVHGAVDRLRSSGDMLGGRDLASRALAVDPSATDIEEKLITLYWHLGNTSAAAAQYQHLAARYKADGLDPPTIEALTADSRPISR